MKHVLTESDAILPNYYIYKITCKPNGKIYIGKTKNLPHARLVNHIWTSTNRQNTSIKLQNAIRKHSPEAFTIEILEVVHTEQDLNAREIFWIKELNARDSNIGYNICAGGEGGSGGPHFAGHRHSAATRQNMSINRTGTKNANYGNRWKRTPDMKYPSLVGKNNPMYGKHQSEEAKEKSRQKHLGKKAFSNIKLDKVIMLSPEDGAELIAVNPDWVEGNIHRVKNK